MLGVSRGTLRTALQRLEATGEIVRRQGSGTFVGTVLRPAAFDEGLERLESYSSLAERRGVRLAVRALRIARMPVGLRAGEALDLPADAVAPVVSRVVLAEDEPAGFMVDTIHPGVPLPPDDDLERDVQAGRMVLDVLLDAGVPVAFAHTRVLPRLVAPGEHPGDLLGIAEATATLELEEVMRTTGGDAVQHSRDLFAPRGLDLHVMRWVGPGIPARVGSAVGDRGARRRGGLGPAGGEQARRRPS